MPIVPVSHQETPEIKPVTLAPAVNITPTENTTDVRFELADALRTQLGKQQTVTTEFLDKFAVSHFSENNVHSPAAWDYAALRQTAEQEETSALQQHRAQALDRERAWTRQVGELTPDNRSLQAYLELQLPAFQARMQENGMSAQESEQAVKQLRAETVEKHIARSLSNADWQTADQVLEAQSVHLPETVKQRCAGQIRHAFARAQAQKLWQHANEPSLSGQQVQEKALAQLNEPDDDLREQIHAEITQLAAGKYRQQAAQQADLFSQLAQLNTREQAALLDAQTVLDATGAARARRVIYSSDNPATPAQQNWFVKNYFNGELDVDKALDKGQCAACDYFRLQAVVQSRAGGKQSRADEWLCRGMRAFMRKQGFDEQETTQAVYTVLSGATNDQDRLQLWKEIKTLLTC